MTAAPGACGADDATVTFEAVRARLHGVAYRMTGSVSDAEDLCQEAWLRWSTVDREEVRDPEGFLVTVVTRLAIDLARSAAVRRESYVGPYLPEPLVSDVRALAVGSQPVPGPEEASELADSLTFAFLVVLDELDPVERAVLLLHDVFGYSFAEVAEAVGRSDASVRQMASRSRRRLAEARGPAAASRPSPDQVGATVVGLLGAVAQGDVEGVMGFLAPDVVQLDDGGPPRRAARRPVVGADRVARYWVNLAKRAGHLTVGVVEVNGQPGLLFSDGDEPDMVASAELDAEGLISRVFVQLNPEKLAHLRPRDQPAPGPPAPG